LATPQESLSFFILCGRDYSSKSLYCQVLFEKMGKYRSFYAHRDEAGDGIIIKMIDFAGEYGW